MHPEGPACLTALHHPRYCSVALTCSAEVRLATVAVLCTRAQEGVAVLLQAWHQVDTAGMERGVA